MSKELTIRDIHAVLSTLTTDEAKYLALKELQEEVGLVIYRDFILSLNNITLIQLDTTISPSPWYYAISSCSFASPRSCTFYIKTTKFTKLLKQYLGKKVSDTLYYSKCTDGRYASARKKDVLTVLNAELERQLSEVKNDITFK